MIDVYLQLFDSLTKVVTKAVAKSQEVSESEDIAVIRKETAKQEVEMRMAEAQARVAQELAIANRIENAEDVEIEEFYDTHGKGALGLKGEPGDFTLGASGEGRRVTRRVYRFKRELTHGTSEQDAER